MGAGEAATAGLAGVSAAAQQNKEDDDADDQDLTQPDLNDQICQLLEEYNVDPDIIDKVRELAGLSRPRPPRAYSEGIRQAQAHRSGRTIWCRIIGW
jgi:hypothetical protein